MVKEESNQEEKNMQAFAKDQGNKGLSLSSKKSKEITFALKLKMVSYYSIKITKTIATS